MGKINPDTLKKLTEHGRLRCKRESSETDMLLAYHGVLLTWVADFVLDENVDWRETAVDVNDLILTGANPELNKIIIEQCQRSPQKLKKLLEDDPAVAALFADIYLYPDTPILVRQQEGEMRVLNGIYEVLVAIRDGVDKIKVTIGQPTDPAKPICEYHVVYDLIRPFHQKRNLDKAGLIAALRYLRHSYSNVGTMLKERFNKDWILEQPELSGAIKESLQD